ncbi:hypothetical protein [Viridibacillus arvi]|uniref:hypothetical protein n=1 Tax=Viridibacillus arvi TaxID=263475 RepID=UPI0034CD7C0C
MKKMAAVKKCTSLSVDEALILLDGMRRRANKSFNSFYLIERIEQAMDYVLNNPTKQGDPRIIVRDQIGSAGKKIRSRINAIKEASEIAGISSPTAIRLDSDDNINHLELEISDEVNKSSLNNQTKNILLCLVLGKEAEDMAEELTTSVTAMRTRISKARKAYKKVAGGVAI